jgi:signal peptidase I
MSESLIVTSGPSDTVRTKPRRAWVAGLLALVQPGLGHLYGGKHLLALFIASIAAILTIISAALAVLFPRWAFPAIITLWTFYAVVWTWQLVSACLLARRKGKTYRLGWYNHVVVYALFVVAVTAISLPASALVRQRFIEAFQIPSASMAPTLLPGDQLIVIKSVGGNWTRGDVVVFRGPGESGIEPFNLVAKKRLRIIAGFGSEQTGHAWIMRIVAMGGDTVEIKDRQVVVNGQAYRQTPCKQSVDFDSSECLIETMPSGKSYSVLYRTAANGRRNYFPPVSVDAHGVYLLGDNRDNSHDSRYFGQVSEERVAGRAAVIWFSYSEADFIRWRRMGLQL